MALIDVLDENSKPTGEAKTKVEIHENGLWHFSAHVWIYNSRGEILLQLRSKIKDSHPGLWDISAAGHVDSGETPIEGALRELNEEIGISADESELKQIDVIKVSKFLPEIGWQNNEFDYVYLFKYEGNVSDLKLQEEEVEKMEFVPLDKFEEEVNNAKTLKKYVPHGDYYQMVIDKVRESLKGV